MQYGRGKEIEEPLPRPRMLLEAVTLFGGCVEGLKKVAVKFNDHDNKTTHAKLKTLLGFRGARGEGTVERLDEWREWSLLDDDECLF